MSDLLIVVSMVKNESDFIEHFIRENSKVIDRFYIALDSCSDNTPFGNSPISPWGHLLFRPMEMFDFICGKCDEKTPREIAYFVYCSPHINRFF